MADSERQEHDNILSGDANLVNTTHMVQVSSAEMGGGVEVSEDILRQAFQEASGPLVQDGVAYANGEVVADASTNISLDGTGVISGVKTTDVIYTLHNASQSVTADDNSVQDLQGLVDSRMEASDNNGFLQEVVTQDDSQHAVVSASGDNYVIRLHNQSNVLQGGLVTVASSENVLQPLQSTVPTVQESGLSHLEATQVNNQAATAQNKVQTIIVQAPSTTNPAPLGSSANPIRIVQQGNQYTSLQQLSAEQLSHIMQVVQQQQLMKLTTESNKPSVIFNPQTQTRIVYKVMYPSELHNRNKNSSASDSVSSGKKQPHQICVPTESVLVSLPKRTYKKRKHKEDDKVEAPEMSKEEKEEKKKHRPRTRSGRISRPPKHMVRDYKHIHPVDWDEDYDDSDGGYSDFKGSSGDEDEPDSRRRKKDSSYTAYSCLGPHGKAKPWKCKVCEKAYIGKAGLARHYRLNPEHGKDDENFKEGFYVNGMDDSSSRDSAPDLADKKPPAQTNGQEQDGVRTSFANCSVINTSTTNSTPTTAAAAATAATNSLKSHSPTVMPGKSLLKNKQGLPQENATAKKKARLKEYIREFTDEDLMETVFPRLAQAVSTWEFMLMKAERGRPARPHLVHLLQEYVQVYREIRRLCEEQLQLVPPGAPPSSGTRIQVSDEKVANALGVSIGLYAVQTKPAKEDPFHYKLLTADPSTCNTNPLSNKRTLETVSAEDLIEAKQDKQHELNNSLNRNKANSQTAAKVLPGQTLLKPDLLSTGDTKPSVTDISMADGAQSENNTTITTAQIQESYPTGSIHQTAPLHSQVVTTQGERHDFNVVNVKSESDTATSSAIMDRHESSFLDNHSSTSPLMSVCFVSTSSVTSSTMADAMNSEHMPEQKVKMEEEQDQSLGHTDMIKMHVEEYVKAENQLLEQPGHLLQPSEPSVEQSEKLLEPTNHQEELGQQQQQQQLMEQSNETFPQSEQLQEETSLQGDMQHSEQSVQQSEQLLNHSEQLEAEQKQPIAHSAESLNESSQEVEQHQHLLPQTGAVAEHSDSIVESTEQLAGEFQLDASQLTAGVTMSVPSDSMSYSSQYVDSEMGQHFVSDGMILGDQGNGQMLLQENILIDQNAEQSGSAEDNNADNRLILIKNPDGTIQVHRQGNQPISMEELQALFGMELDANLLTTETSDEVLQ